MPREKTCREGNERHKEFEQHFLVVVGRYSAGEDDVKLTPFDRRGKGDLVAMVAGALSRWCRRKLIGEGVSFSPSSFSFAEGEDERGAESSYCHVNPFSPSKILFNLID